jgi:PAS domain S-box-containing protein
MNKLKQLSVGKQVVFAFGTLCAILLVIGGLFFFSLRAIERSSEVQQARALNKLALIDDTAQDVGQLQAAVLRQILASDAGEIKSLDKTVHDIEKINAQELADYQKFADTDKEKQLYDKVMQTRKAYWELTQPVLAFGRDNRDAEAIKLFNERQAPAYDEFLKAVNELADYVEADAKESSRATTRFISEIRIIGDVLVGVTILIVIGTGFAVARIAGELKEDNRVLQNEIAERKRAQETLRMLSSAVEQAKESVTITDANLDLPGPKIVFVNPAFTKMTGYTAAEVIGKTPRILQGPRTDKTILARLRKKLEQGEVFEGEAINYRKDGTEFDLEWQIAPIRDASGKITHFTAIQRDITARKRLEAQLFQSQKMETVGKLSGGIAHEFNSILTAIIGQSELLLGDLPADSPLTKNATEISNAAVRAATLTRQLLAYGRKQMLQPEILDLNLVLAGMESTLQHLMGRDVDVRIVPGAGLKAVKMDPGQMEQVIVNIAMNAAAVMPNGGKFTLETANVTLDQEYVSHFQDLKAGEYVMLAMTDTGTGISPEVKKNIFEPFFTTKGVGQGTGLGLATCYGILKQSGGHINVYSELSRGATFKVYLPQVEARPKIPAPRPGADQLPRGTETILLVEDDPALREMASTLLTRLGYTVLAAADGVEALSLKHRQGAGHVDLVFTDVVMPHMSGKELSDRFRILYPQTKILFTSAYTENAIVHQGVLNPGVTLLQKPFTPSALACKVREVLDRNDGNAKG